MILESGSDNAQLQFDIERFGTNSVQFGTKLCICDSAQSHFDNAQFGMNRAQFDE